MSDISFWKPLYQTFKPDKALMGRDLDDLYVRRTKKSPADRLVQRIEVMDEPIKFLLSGHRGSGKTTELRRVEKLCRVDYTVVWVDAETNLDNFNVRYAEVVLLIGKRIVDRLGEIGWPLPEKLSQDLTRSLARVTLQDKEDAGGSLQLPDVLQKLGLLLKVGFQRDRTSTIDIRPAVSSTVNAVNAIIQAAEENRPKLLVIVDGLDKLDYAIALDAFRNSLLTELDCHIVYTIPIALRYSSEFSQASEMFPHRLDVMNPPVFKCDEHNRPTLDPDKEGRYILTRVVQKRLEQFGDLYKGLFEADALNLLCEKSGGVLRDLIKLAVNAFDAAQEEQKKIIDFAIAQMAIREEQNIKIRDYYFPELEHVHNTGQFTDTMFDSPEGKILIGDKLLESKLVLGYESPQGSPWFDIHPIRLEALERWQSAKAEKKS